MQIKINSVGDRITAGLVATVIGMGVFFQFKKCNGRDKNAYNYRIIRDISYSVN